MFTHKQPSYSHYTVQPKLAGIPSQELEDFVEATFYCPACMPF